MEMSDTTRSSIHISNIVCVCRRVHPYVVFKKLSPDNYPVIVWILCWWRRQSERKKTNIVYIWRVSIIPVLFLLRFNGRLETFPEIYCPPKGLGGGKGTAVFTFFFFVFRFFIYERESAPSPDENAEPYSRRRIYGQGTRGPGTEPSDFRRRNAGFPPSIFFLFFYRSNFHFRKFFITSDKWPVHPVVTPTCPYRKIYYFIINFFFFSFQCIWCASIIMIITGVFTRSRSPRKDAAPQRRPAHAHSGFIRRPLCRAPTGPTTDATVPAPPRRWAHNRPT